MSESRATNTRVVREGDDSILTGHTTLVSIAPDADLFLIFAIRAERDPMTSSAFIIERESPGVRVTPNAGPRAKQSVQVEFESCRLSAAHRLGPDGGAATILESSMDWQRACILAPCVGAMRRQLEACVEHARTHEEFGQPVGKRQSVASCLVDMRMRWETARSLLYRAAWSKQGGGRAPLESAVAKLYIGESWVKNCLDAIQVYGTGGHPIEYQLEHDLRDAVDGTLYSGTSEMQRDVIARRLGL
jgi:alkylation response protein AidB-like acyl-CoA dehydrogenase